jgi:hypothetical protein
MDKTYLTKIVRNKGLLWEQRDKNYNNRDLKPELWNETGQKLHFPNTEIVTLKKWVAAYLYTESTFNFGTFYVRMVSIVTNIY